MISYRIPLKYVIVFTSFIPIFLITHISSGQFNSIFCSFSNDLLSIIWDAFNVFIKWSGISIDDLKQSFPKVVGLLNKKMDSDSVIGLGYITNIKEFIYFICLFIVSLFLVPDITKIARGISKETLIITAKIFSLFLAIFISVKLVSMGTHYGYMSLSPFNEQSRIFSSKLLMPSLAYFLQFKGPLLYLVFSHLLSFILILLLITWLFKEEIYTDIFDAISISTSSFIGFNFFFPGYPDILLSILIFLIYLFELSKTAKISIFGLALAAHPSSVILLFPLLIKDRGSIKVFYILLLSIYFLILFASYQFDLSLMLSINESDSTIKYLLMNPKYWIFGHFFSFKLLWFIIFIALALMVQSKTLKESVDTTSLLMVGVIISVLGLDTSRLMGLCFPALLICYKYLKSDPAAHRYKINYIVKANLAIPFIYVGLNTGYLFSKPFKLLSLFQ